MTDELGRILDECIDRINRGESVDACLTDHPGLRRELEPLLAAMVKTRAAYPFATSAGAKNRQKQRFNEALVASREERSGRKPFARRLLGWSKVWAPALAVIAIGLVVYFGVRPGFQPPVTVVEADPAGNFAFLMSDEPNDIGDFAELNVTISKVTLRLGGDQEQDIVFTPTTHTVDLVNLQGDLAQEIWKGSIPPGEYTRVVIEVSEVSGILRDSGEAATIKLPGSKLQISKPFTVEAGQETSFVYDLTVVRAGKSGQHILKPQAGQSGADRNFNSFEPAVHLTTNIA